MQDGRSKRETTEDRWISSACSMTYNMCSIKGHVVNGTVVKLEGNPDSPIGAGRMCPKGVAGIMTLYDPNRINKPLKRTNPEKGIGVDPRFVDISWDEALDIVVEKLKQCRDKDSRELFVQGTTTSTFLQGLFPFCSAFGTRTFWGAGGGLHCGNGAHELNGVTHAAWSSVPDFPRCNYAMYFGASKGHAAGHAANTNAQLAADARARGMQMVVVDPMCNFASAKATEWVPIKPGTDAAMALSMCNVLVNEYGTYDATYIERYTNGPYLIGPDGHYIRDTETNKPLVWDKQNGKAKTFDDSSITRLAILGDFEVNGVPCQPGFELLKEHLKKYTPEYASSICTVPASLIRRLAKEFGEAARIGSTIVIDGVELPYRPAAAIYFRGVQGHVNSTFNCLSVDLLNELVGSADVPGGVLGFSPVCFGHPDTGRPSYAPHPCPDGLMITGDWMSPHLPYPPHRPSAPKTPGLVELHPFGMSSAFLGSSDAEEWYQKFDVKLRPRMLLNYGANSMMSVANKETLAERLMPMEFIVSFDLFLNEFTDFADVVLPDACYLERCDPSPNHPFIFAHPASEGLWGYPIRQPMVEPVAERRYFIEVLYEIAERLGIREGMNIAYNVLYQLRPPYALDPEKSYTWEEICDQVLKDRFGEQRGLEWFKEHGVITWPKQVKEVYWRTFTPVRVPIYFELFQTAGEQVREVARKFDAEDWINYMVYQALPDWNPCPSHQVKDPQFDLWSIYYRDVLHTNSFTMENPWLDEASLMNPYTYNISIHTKAATEKGLADGDLIWVESSYGRRVQGRVKVTEGIHPETIGIAACAGHWSPHQPIARGKGVFYNELIEIDYEHMDPGNLSIDLCAKVKVYKAES